MMALTYMGTARVLLRSVISTSNRFLISERRHFDGAPTTSDLLLTTDVNEMRERVRLVPSGQSKLLHAYWMTAARTRAFGIIVILAESEFNLVGSPLCALPSNAVPSRRRIAKRARAAGISQRLARCVAMWCDAQRRVVERCDAPGRAALPTVMSISPTRPID
jgi:hypothetical protein